jgi:hypothetical protein
MLLVCCGGPVTVVKAVLDGFADGLRPSGDNESESVTEAQRRAILVSEWSVAPPALEIQGGRLEFGEAWVEERSRSTRRLVWFSAEDRVGGYRLHVPYTFRADGQASGSMMLVPDDNGVGHAVGQDRGMYTLFLDDPDVAGLRLSVVESFQAPRDRNIRLIPQAK